MGELGVTVLYRVFTPVREFYRHARLALATDDNLIFETFGLPNAHVASFFFQVMIDEKIAHEKKYEFIEQCTYRKHR